jgi:broad specificity phosphatase PhoE
MWSVDAMNPCILVRHGETEMAGRFCGHSDPPLNHAGRKQIEEAAALLTSTPPEVIYSSDLKRALQSAQLLAIRFAAPVHLRVGLREICFGAWEGLWWQEIEQRFPQHAQVWMERYPHGVIPSGEAYDQFSSRVDEEATFLLEQAKTRSVVAVTHAGFIRTALINFGFISHAEAYHRSAQYACTVPIQSAERSRR